MGRKIFRSQQAFFFRGDEYEQNGAPQLLGILSEDCGLIDQEGAADPRSEPEIRGRKSRDVDCVPGSMGYGMKPPPGGPTPEYRVADITLTVCYRPRFWPWETKQSERFIGRTDGSHKIVEWSHQATDVGKSFECP